MRPLAVEGQGGEADWVQLSRKHAIDVDNTKRFVSIFGGKLTDGINVGEEVAETMQSLGIAMSKPNDVLYGESGDAFKQAFLARAFN